MRQELPNSEKTFDLVGNSILQLRVNKVTRHTQRNSHDSAVSDENIFVGLPTILSLEEIRRTVWELHLGFLSSHHASFYGSLNSPACSCVSITLPISR